MSDTPAQYWRASAENAEERGAELASALAQIARTGDAASQAIARKALTEHIEAGGAHRGDLDDVLGQKAPEAGGGLSL
jgi:hypothetical protein